MDAHQKVVEILEKCRVENGFLATAVSADNYNRVWARDSAITALAILSHRLERFYPTIKKAIYALANYQSAEGIIPSNIPSVDSPAAHISYGSLVGRVDATTWWLIQTNAYIALCEDEAMKQRLQHSIYKALSVLNCWEFNGRNLIYTPIGGNWADEYVTTGYTLYDNLLRYWAVNLTSRNYADAALEAKAKAIHRAIDANFNPLNTTTDEVIHPRAHKLLTAKNNTHWPSAFSPAGYDERWDMAANALAMYLGFNTTTCREKAMYLHREYSHWMLPVFHPIIDENSSDWGFLAENYNYNFKNKPHHFHNGGSWPVMLGLFCLGLSAQGETTLPHEIMNDYQTVLRETDFSFHEYMNPLDKQCGGLGEMCFSVSGWLFMQQAIATDSPLFTLI